MKFSDKQITSFADSDAFFNIWIGAVRSGKSFVALYRFIEHVKNGPEGEMVIIGTSQGALKRNIIPELQTILQTDMKHYRGYGEIHVWGRKIHLIGASDEKAVRAITGPTFVGALIDEITLIPHNFFLMLRSRLSKQGSKMFATCNPQSPYHWLKTDYIDKKNELDNVKIYDFYLDDNPSLDEDYKNSLKREYKGMWYKRYIEGQWCLAEGLVYDFFDENMHVIEYVEGFGSQYIIGVDYGTTNACSFLLIGLNFDSYPNMWVEKEYYWDSKEEQRQKTDSEYAEDLEKFAKGYNVSNIYIDPSAASFIAELRRSTHLPIFQAQNEVLDGVRFVAKLFSNGQLKITKICKNLIKEMMSYRWDEKSIKLGFDRPIKEKDHAVDALRYALFTHLFNKDTKGLDLSKYRELKRHHSGYGKTGDIHDFLKPGW